MEFFNIFCDFYKMKKSLNLYARRTALFINCSDLTEKMVEKKGERSYGKAKL